MNDYPSFTKQVDKWEVTDKKLQEKLRQERLIKKEEIKAALNEHINKKRVESLVRIDELTDIGLCPHYDLFDFRPVEDHHVDAIQKSLEGNLYSNEADPILIWQQSDKLFVIDGRHRAEAYKRMGRDEIKAAIITGGLKDAIIAAHLKNNKPSKSYTAKEKSQRAWTYVLADWDEEAGTFEPNKQNYTFSEKFIQGATERKSRTTQNMRKVARELLERHGTIPRQYWEAMQLHSTGIMNEIDMRTRNEQIDELAATILRAIQQSNNPEAQKPAEALFRAMLASGGAVLINRIFRTYFDVPNANVRIDDKINANKIKARIKSIEADDTLESLFD